MYSRFSYDSATPGPAAQDEDHCGAEKCNSNTRFQMELRWWKDKSFDKCVRINVIELACAGGICEKFLQGTYSYSQISKSGDPLSSSYCAITQTASKQILCLAMPCRNRWSRQPKFLILALNVSCRALALVCWDQAFMLLEPSRQMLRTTTSQRLCTTIPYHQIKWVLLPWTCVAPRNLVSLVYTECPSHLDIPCQHGVRCSMFRFLICKGARATSNQIVWERLFTFRSISNPYLYSRRVSPGKQFTY